MLIGREFLERLRHETSPAHRRLERDLGITEQTVSQERVLRLLSRFHGFYRQWEPWVEASAIDSGFFAPRRKLALVENDLRSLGLADPQRLPGFPFPLGDPRLERVMGSLYVIEGSTLGGQLIGRWLHGKPWLPGGGLSYFNPYGTAVGAMWQAFQAELVRLAEQGSADLLVDAANRTFEHLHLWLCDERAAA